MINVAVLITCHNRKQKTIKCLQSLFKQKNIKNIRTKVFLVDDGSTDGTSKAIKNLFPSIKIIKGNANLFWAKGMFLAWQCALNAKEKFDYFLWLNDDVVLFNTAINELLETRKKNTEIIVGSVCDPITKRRTYGGWKFAKKFMRPFLFKVVNIKNKPQKIDVFNGNVVLIPETVYNEVGIIDNLFKHAYADIEYSLRAKKNGITILLAKKYLGKCSANTFDHKAFEKKSLYKKILTVFDDKNKPLSDWFRMTYKYGGIFWLLHFFTGYIKSIIKILYNHKYFNLN